MAGINQLPAGAEGVAAFVLIYSSISWVCSILLIWCATLYHEAWSYVSLLAYFALMSDTASIIQQAYDVTYYQDLLRGQFYRKTTFLENPELAIANGSYGFDLVLYYIQYYSYNVGSMLVMFWAFELAQSVYGLSAKPHLRQALRRINAAGKLVAVLFPTVTILLLRAPAVQKVFIVFILLADLPLMLSLAISSTTMIAILVRYVQSRKKISNWTPDSNSTSATNETSTDTIQTTAKEEGKKTSPSQGRPGLYDRWLMVRFIVAFVILASFEVTNTLFQLQSINNNRKDATLTEPDFSLDRAKTTLFLYMPGVTPGTFLFLVFGTTAGCRTALKAIFVSQPRRTTSIRPGRPFGRPWTKVESSKKAPQDPFVDSSRSILSTNRVSAPAFPATALVSKYNKSPHSRNDQPRAQATHQTHLYSWSRKYSNAEEMIMGEETAMELQGLTSTQRTHENYYQPSPEQSDDSGPVLLIMSTQDKRRSPGKTELAVSPSS